MSRGPLDSLINVTHRTSDVRGNMQGKREGDGKKEKKEKKAQKSPGARVQRTDGLVLTNLLAPGNDKGQGGKKHGLTTGAGKANGKHKTVSRWREGLALSNGEILAASTKYLLPQYSLRIVRFWRM